MDPDIPPPLPPCAPPEDDSSGGLPLWANLLLAAGLVGLSGIFSGLTLGLLSLDKTGLQVLAEAGTPREKELAKQIMPLRRNGNLLLCTLLIGNVIVNSVLSILLADLTSGAVGVVVSTALIVVLGEIVPQATCSRHGLVIGAATRHITMFFIVALYILAKPISMGLDFALGKEIGNYYSRDELKGLLQLHANDAHAQKESGLTNDDHNLLAGALEYSRKTVADVMTQLERVFMLEATMKLTFETMLDIYKSGFTRIPVYEGSRDNVLGILYVKDLILVDPDDEIEVQTVVTFRGPSQVRYIVDSTPLNEVFKIFKSSYTHLMIAVAMRNPLTNQILDGPALREAPQYVLLQCTKEVTGVITLEDILEEVIKDEIVDEHDVYMSNETNERIKKSRDRPDISTFLSIFDHKVRESSKLSRQEVQAVAAFLVARVKEFAPFAHNKAVLRALIRRAAILDVDNEDDNASTRSVDLLTELPQADVGSRVGDHVVLYKRTEPASTMTLVLQGWVLVWAGSEEFESELGPWSHMANNALHSHTYRPDFTAVTQGQCRLMRIERAEFLDALNMAQAGASNNSSMQRASRDASRVSMSQRGGGGSATGGTRSPVSTAVLQQQPQQQPRQQQHHQQVELATLLNGSHRQAAASGSGSREVSAEGEGPRGAPGEAPAGFSVVLNPAAQAETAADPVQDGARSFMSRQLPPAHSAPAAGAEPAKAPLTWTGSLPHQSELRPQPRASLHSAHSGMQAGAPKGRPRRADSPALSTNSDSDGSGAAGSRPLLHHPRVPSDIASGTLRLPLAAGAAAADRGGSVPAGGGGGEAPRAVSESMDGASGESFDGGCLRMPGESPASSPACVQRTFRAPPLASAADTVPPSGRDGGAHTLEGVVVVGPDGVPLCIQGSQLRPLQRVPSRQGVAVARLSRRSRDGGQVRGGGLRLVESSSHHALFRNASLSEADEGSVAGDWPQGAEGGDMV